MCVRFHVLAISSLIYVLTSSHPFHSALHALSLSFFFHSFRNRKFCSFPVYCILKFSLLEKIHFFFVSQSWLQITRKKSHSAKSKWKEGRNEENVEREKRKRKYLFIILKDGIGISLTDENQVITSTNNFSLFVLISRVDSSLKSPFWKRSKEWESGVEGTIPSS